MTIGNGYFPQGEDFAFTRTLIYRVAFSGILGTPIIAGNVFVFPANPTTLFDYVCVFRPSFIPWSSNHYNLGSLLSEYYYMPPGGGVHSPVDYSLQYFPATGPSGAYVLNIPFGVATTPNFFSLALAPDGFWLPNL